MNRKQGVRTARILSLIVGAAGITVITGWIFDISVLKSLSPGWISMKLSTAFAFFLSGVALYFTALAREGEYDTAQAVLSVTSLLLVLIMGTLFFSSLLALHTGIEDLFIEDKGDLVKSVAPGRPSVPTMLNFLLTAAGGILMILNAEKPRLKLVGSVIAAIGALAVAGYVSGIPVLYYYISGVNSAMACHTAVLFVLLGAGFICLSD